jgi:hypothetical protein
MSLQFGCLCLIVCYGHGSLGVTDPAAIGNLVQMSDYYLYLRNFLFAKLFPSFHLLSINPGQPFPSPKRSIELD